MNKIINIVRYIFAVPAAYIGSRLVYIITSLFSHDPNTQSSRITGAYGMSNIELYLVDCILCSAIYVYLIYRIAPKHKKIYSCVGSVVYGAVVAILPLIYTLMQGYELRVIISSLLVLGTLIAVNIALIMGFDDGEI